MEPLWKVSLHVMFMMKSWASSSAIRGAVESASIPMFRPYTSGATRALSCCEGGGCYGKAEGAEKQHGCSVACACIGGDRGKLIASLFGAHFLY
jgi:hypothetical protein